MNVALWLAMFHPMSNRHKSAWQQGADRHRRLVVLEAKIKTLEHTVECTRLSTVRA